MIDTQPFCDSLGGRPIAVFGLGLSGMATAKALRNGGCNVAVWDDETSRRDQAQAEGFRLRSYEDGYDGFAALVLSPGVPLTHPAPHEAVTRANAAACAIIGDIEIFQRAMPSVKTVGITGTNGKSTTTALVAHILKQGGLDAIAAGNIGKPVLDLDLDASTSVAVLELSSYQIDLCPTFRPTISVLLNFSADHLDRHGGMDGYVAAKERILEGSGIAIIGIDDEHARTLCKKYNSIGARSIVTISGRDDHHADIHVREGVLIDGGTEIARVDGMRNLPGSHNMQNLCAAYAVAKTFGLTAEAIIAAAKSFEGLPHRQQVVSVIDGVPYVNDSKATNAEATARALSSYANGIYLIAGGRAKQGGLDGIEPYLDRLRHVYLIGEAEDAFAAWLEKRGVPHSKCHVLKDAVAKAHDAAQASRGEPGGAATVLLSPACASWDQFRNFEHRGEAFADIVKAFAEGRGQ